MDKGRNEARKLADLVFDGLGAAQRTHVDGYFGAGHVMGTYRMGTDARSSVVDPAGRTHDHANLCLVGSGVFPTGGTANPTLTLAALALMTADAIGRSLDHEMKTTAYFDEIRKRSDRAIIKDEWIERVVVSPVRQVVQPDGRIRRWAPIPEMDNRHLRVILLPDGETVHNAFFDGRFAS